MNGLVFLLLVVVYLIITAITACFLEDRMPSGQKVLLPALGWWITLPYLTFTDMNTLRMQINHNSKNRRKNM